MFEVEYQSQGRTVREERGVNTPSHPVGVGATCDQAAQAAKEFPVLVAAMVVVAAAAVVLGAGARAVAEVGTRSEAAVGPSPPVLGGRRMGSSQIAKAWTAIMAIQRGVEVGKERGDKFAQ